MVQRFETFVASISNINRCIQKIKDKKMADLGMKRTHTMCLFHLNHCQTALTSAELAQLCAENKAAISRTLHDLSKMGLVTFDSAESGKKYRTKIFLTEQGREAAVQMNRMIETIVEIGGNGLSDAQRTVFYKALLLISENLTAYAREGC